MQLGASPLNFDGASGKPKSDEIIPEQKVGAASWVAVAV